MPARARRHIPLAIRVLALSLSAPACLAQVKAVYLAPDDHTDYFWTADDAQYRQAFLDTLDYYLDLADSTAANPPQFQSKWNCDGHQWMWEYERGRSPAQFQRLIDRIVDGHITVPLNALAVNEGAAPMENVLRGMYYPGRIQRRLGAPANTFSLAYNMENMTHPMGLWSLWAGSGAKYSWKGVCGCDNLTSAGPRAHEIYWAVGKDGSRVLVKWNTLFNGNNQGIGGYAEAFDPNATVDFVTTNAPFNGFLAAYSYDIIGAFGKGWDGFQNQSPEFVTVAQAKTNAQRQIIVSNEHDFFEAFQARYGATLPEVSLSYGNEWELYCPSLAEQCARIKRSMEKLRAAEAMASIVSLSRPAFMVGREPARDLAFQNLGLFWEHDFGMFGPPTGQAGITKRVAWQKKIATEIESYVNTLHTDALTALAELVPDPGAGTQFLVFNPLGWTRTDIADLPYTDAAAVHVTDLTTNTDVPSQRITINGQKYLRVLASNIPSVGYKVFEIRPGVGQVFSDAATVTGGPNIQTVTLQVAADDRDAQSTAHFGTPDRVLVSGFDGLNDPYVYFGSDSDQQTAGVEFTVNIPRGVTILSANLVLRGSPASNPSPTGATRVNLYDVDDAQPFVNGPFGDLLNHHPVWSTTVLWPAAAWSSGGDNTSPDLTALVQHYIDRPGYAPGKNIGLCITEGTIQPDRYYGFDDFFKPGAQPARLVITYNDPNGSSGGDSLVVDNSVYTLTADTRGAITSLIDKAHASRQLVGTAGPRALNLLGSATAGTLAVENVGPVSVTLLATSPGPVTHTSRITVYRDSQGVGGRIDLDNQITQNFTDSQRYSFDLNLNQSTTRHEEVGAILTAKLATSGGDYATQNARYDWLTLNHFADLTDASGTAGVTLSNADCLFAKLGNSSVTSLDATSANVTVLAGGSGGNAGAGLPNQGSDTLFTQRFALRAHAAYDQTAAMKTSLDHQNPLIARVITGTDPTLPALSYSAVQISNPDTLLWALKPAEEGIADPVTGGLIARLWNVSESPRTPTIQLAPSPVQIARATTHIETDTAALPVTPVGVQPSFTRQQVRTLRLLTTCPSDFDRDGFVTGDDFDAYVVAFELGDAAADFDHDGFVTGDDFDAYVLAFEGGC